MAERETVRNLTEASNRAETPSALDRPFIGSMTLEKFLYLLLWAVIVFTRLYQLGDRPYHHDESIHAFYSWKIVDEGLGNYKYDPVYHGPVLYYASALMMKIFGDGDFQARLSAVAFGFGILAFAWPLRKFMGRWSALMFLVLATFSPALNYFTRFIRHDVYVGLGNMMAVYFAFLYGRSRKATHLYVAAVGLAIAFCNKEDMYVLGPVMVLSLLLMQVWEIIYAGDWRKQLSVTWGETAAFLKSSALPIITSLIIFLVVCLTFYTSIFTHPENWNPVRRALEYWIGQHTIKRIGGPWWYYFPQLIAYEPVILVPMLLLLFGPVLTPQKGERRSTTILEYLTLASTVLAILIIFLNQAGLAFGMFVIYDSHTGGLIFLLPLGLAGLTLMRRWLPDPFIRFLCMWTIGCFCFYCWAQEKVPWLLFPMVMPSALLAGQWFGRMIEEKRLSKPAVFVPVGILAVLTLWSFVAVNYLYSAPRPDEGPNDSPKRTGELLAYVQSTYDIQKVMHRIEDVSRIMGTGDKTRLAVGGNATWPLSWYLRHYPVNWAADVRNVDTPVVITDLEVATALDKALLEKYEKVRFEIRGWWEPDWTKLNVTTFAKWWATRVAFNGVGSSDAVMYVLKDIKPGVALDSIAVNPPPAAKGYNAPPSLEKPAAVWGVRGVGAGQFNEPRGIAVDGEGNVYVVDSKNNRLQKLSAQGVPITSWGKEGDTPGDFKDPGGVALGPDASVFVADTWNHRIQKFDKGGKFLAEWKPDPGFWGPRGVAVSADGNNVYVTDTGNKRIVRFDGNGKQLGVWGKEGSKPGEFIEPVGIAVDTDGSVYVADTGNHRVQVFSADGTFLREIPILGWEEFYSEPYIALYGGELWVTDSYNHRVARYKDGQNIGSWGKSGAADGDFNRPIGIAADRQGAAYVADTMNNRIQKFVLPAAK